MTKCVQLCLILNVYILRANQLNANIGLGIIEYLDKEMDYVPRTAANKQLSYLDSMLSKSNYYGKFKVFYRT